MPKIVLTNQYFDRGDGSKNMLIHDDWMAMADLPADVRIWIPAAAALQLIDEHRATFYGLINSGEIDSHWIKSNSENWRGTCLVPLLDTLNYELKRMSEKFEKDKSKMEKTLRSMGTAEDAIQKTLSDFEQGFNTLRESIREGQKELLRGEREFNGPAIVASLAVSRGS